MTRAPFFASDEWAGVLKLAFGAASLPSGSGWNWSIFSRLGLRIAYPRFPVGVHPFSGVAYSEENLSRVAASADLIRLDGAFPDSWVHRARHVARQPRSVIRNLACWSPDLLASSVRRKLRRSHADMHIRKAVASEGKALHQLYLSTLSRRQGTARYTARYFQVLCELALTSSDLSVYVAVHKESIAGFIVTAYEDGAAYYLHAGFDPACASLRPGYALMGWAITQARDAGCGSFDMLTSPSAQISLVRYKESFGAHTFVQNHWDVPLTRWGRLIALALALRGRAG